MTQEPSEGNKDLKKQLYLTFYARFAEECQVMGKSDRKR